jgi:hypothetical protein
MPGSLPGERRGGRKAGTPNKATASREADIKAEGLTPLDYMLQVLRDETAEKADRMWAAEKAAPYVHPKLASVEHMGKDGGPISFVFKTVYADH